VVLAIIIGQCPSDATVPRHSVGGGKTLSAMFETQASGELVLLCLVRCPAYRASGLVVQADAGRAG
jgi:hypothetical protein